MTKAQPQKTVISREDAEEYTQSVGQVVAGGWRQVALGHRMGVPRALGITTTEWVEHRLGGYVRMSIPERREAVAELTDGGMSKPEIADVLGVGEATVSRDRGAVSNDTAGAITHDQEASSAVSNDADPKQQAREERERETKTRREVSRSASVLPDAMDYRVGDCREVLASVPDCSVQLVLTDPPYLQEADPLWEWLADWSARVLIPGGSLVTFTAHARLDRDLITLGRCLRYWWLLARLQDAPANVQGRYVKAEFKPVLWFVKDYRRGRSLVTDVLRTERDAKVKAHHAWGQSADGLNFLIEHLTEPGETVADPFAGTGRWGELAVGMGRRWIGSDTTNGGRSEVVS